jgi:hypothetical protein
VTDCTICDIVVSRTGFRELLTPALRPGYRKSRACQPHEKERDALTKVSAQVNKVLLVSFPIGAGGWRVPLAPFAPA